MQHITQQELIRIFFIALKYHPDKSKGTEDLFKCVQAALEKVRENKHEKSSAAPSQSEPSSFEQFFRRSERPRRQTTASVPRALSVFESTTASVSLRNVNQTVAKLIFFADNRPLGFARRISRLY
mmetsp:Transcript_12906/g.16039  ORF Transcript_12906/g.16039 Transcript_12906/m.16039 type:complete len:125 (+) Transcript_12906:230-604(+)